MWAVWVMVIFLFRNKKHCQSFMDTWSFSLSNCICDFGWCHSVYGPSLTPILDPSCPVCVEVVGHTVCYKAQHIFLSKQWQSLSEEGRNKELCVIDNNKYVGNRSVCQGSITSSALWVDENVYTLAEYCQKIIERNSSELNGNNLDNKKPELTTCHTGLSWQKAFLTWNCWWMQHTWVYQKVPRLDV
jgi:hypothetical protein